jgi:outer membrane protein assembly factor BamB
MWRRFSLCIFTALIHSGLAYAPWFTAFGTNARRSWAQGGSGVPTDTVAWNSPRNCTFVAAPLLDSSGSSFVLNANCGAAFDDRGHLLWSNTIGWPSCNGSPQPTLNDASGTIQIGFTNCGLIAGLFSSNGSYQWSSFTNAAAVGPTLLLSGTNLTLMPLWDFSVPAISDSGASAWSWQAPGAPVGTFAQGRSPVIYAMYSASLLEPAYLVALDTSSLSPLWTTRLSSPQQDFSLAGVALSEDETLLYYVATRPDGSGDTSWYLYAVHTSNGTTSWMVSSPPSTTCTGVTMPAVGPDGAVLLAWLQGPSFVLASFDGTTGGQQWVSEVGPRGVSATTLGVAVDAVGNVHAFATTIGAAFSATGKRMFAYRIPDCSTSCYFSSPPSIRDDGTLLIATASSLLAFAGKAL